MGPEIHRDVTLSHARNLKGLQNFTGVQIRLALIPLQRQLKHQLDDYRWGTFQKDSSGRFPVAVRYLYDGTPYLWHFGRREKIAPPMTSRPRAMSDASVPDREIARFSSGASPSPSKSAALSDLSALSAASVATRLRFQCPRAVLFRLQLLLSAQLDYLVGVAKFYFFWGARAKPRRRPKI